VLAKAITAGPPDSADPAAWAAQVLGHVRTIARTFAPFLENSLVVSAPVPIVLPLIVSGACWVLASAGTAALARRLPELGLFFWAFTAYRVLALPPVYFDWYTPPVAAVGVVLIAAGVDRWFPAAAARRAIALTGAAAFAIPLVFTIGLEARVQHEIEDGVRVPLGQYLASVVDPRQPVASEAAGYVGYYSGATIYDYPGLTSKAALAAVRTLPRQERSVAAMISVLRTPWIVVRPDEWAALQDRDPALAASYDLCRSFDSATGSSVSWGNLELRTIDDHFDVRFLGECPGE
jgi:hypothetical protein